jgi:hypothetical protein
MNLCGFCGFRGINRGRVPAQRIYRFTCAVPPRALTLKHRPVNRNRDGSVAEGPRAREPPDLVIVAVHACTEYDTEPNSDQVTDAHTLLASPDIDLVYGTTRASCNPCRRSTGNG